MHLKIDEPFQVGHRSSQNYSWTQPSPAFIQEANLDLRSKYFKLEIQAVDVKYYP